MFSLAENFRIDPKFHSLDLQEYFVRVEAGEPSLMIRNRPALNAQELISSWALKIFHRKIHNFFALAKKKEPCGHDRT